MDPLPIALPAAPIPVRRNPLSFMAAIVPVVGGVVLWLISGSVFALCFAALGPVMIAASFIDAARSRRRQRRRDEAQAELDWGAAEAELVRRHQDERDALWLRRPDVASCLVHPPLRSARAPDAETPVVVGAGSVASTVRCSGGDDDRSRRFHERCSVLAAAPIVVPLGGGICLRGPRPLTTAAARAIVAQLCLRFSALQLSLVGAEVEGIRVSGFSHAAGSRRRCFRLGVASAGATPVEADALIWLASPGAEVPEGITTVIDLAEPAQSGLRTPHGASVVAVECLSAAQVEMIAREHTAGDTETTALPVAVALHELEQPPHSDGLAATLGRGEHGDVTVDIVEDGPHALVTGMTGTGKSELLATWVTAIASANGPERVTFVLADFKGGTAFEPLRELRQVAAVITDLDEEGARRGVSSLTAELRRREAVLAATGARDVREVAMPRLIIVVDEFAAMLSEHPDLGAVFTDVAARGRALGMHLILGTQRAAGVVREALAANCPLRLSLRVGDAADSRLVIGSDAASELPGGAGSRGLGLVRRPVDTAPVPMRIALTRAADLRAIGLRWADHAPPLSPWLDALPKCLPLAELTASAAGASTSVIVGRADDPAHQSQPLETLAVGEDRGLVLLGAPGSGRSTALRSLATQRADTCWVPRDPEAAWDMLSGWATGASLPPSLVLCDDIDVQLSSFPAEYAQHMVQFWEQVVRGAEGTSFVLTAARATGPLSRVFDALPRRAFLRMPSRLEHLAAGGDASAFVRDRTPGRARIGDREVQIAWTNEGPLDEGAHVGHFAWSPSHPLTAVVSAGAPSVAGLLRDAHPEAEVIHVGAEVNPSSLHGGRCILVADAETWQRNWSSWQRVRAEGEVLIRAEQPGDLRQLAGVRELPPYARPHAGRLWSVRGAAAPRRVTLVELSPR